jgi:tetratricopeptide (TPR) repeat protein
MGSGGILKALSLLAALSLALLALPARGQDAPNPTGRPGPGKAVWAASCAEARERAAKENKLVYVEFFKDECGNCHRMHQLLYPAVEFEMTLLRMVPVQLHLASKEATELQARYKIAEAPSVLIVSPKGALIFRVEGFDNDRVFYAHVHRSLADWDKVNVRMLHESEILDDPKAELALGADLYNRLDPEEAIPHFERAADSPKADPETRDTALAALASARYDLGRVAEARTAVDGLLAHGTDPDLLEKAQLFRAQIAAREGDYKDARARLTRFLKEHPDSKHREDAEKLLASIPESPKKAPAASKKQ